MNQAEASLLTKIKSRRAKIGLIGVGYVGLAIGKGAAKKGYKVIGYGRSPGSKQNVEKLNIRNFTPTNSIEDLGNCDIICICVPTPVFEDKTPDLSPLIDALTKTLAILKKGQLIIIESSIAPGMTREIAVPILLKSGFRLEKDFFLSFSPERIDPGNPEYDFSKIPKVVAGYGKKSLKLSTEFYKDIVVKVHPVSSLEVAEMSKILENTFRLVNISLINELTEYTKAIGIDIWEVIEAAKTKPFGFMAHYPGPGIGGHCIPVDPYYLLKDANNKGIDLSIVKSAGLVNDSQPEKVVDYIKKLLNKFSNGKIRDKILVLGVAYKPNIPDIRETPAEPIISQMEKDGFIVEYHDPHIAEFLNKKSLPLTSEIVKGFDLVVIVTHHDAIDYEMLLDFGVPILDTRNVIQKKGRKISIPHPTFPELPVMQVFRLFHEVSI